MICGGGSPEGTGGLRAKERPLMARRRRISSIVRRTAACGLVVAAIGMAPAALAQGSRAWAGADGTAREPLRVAEVPPSQSAAGEPSGDAAIPTGNLLATIRDGGILMVPLLGCSFALAVFGIERAVSLRTSRVVPKLFVSRFIEQLQAGELSRGAALDACDENGSPAARVFAAAVRRWGKPAVEIEQAAIDACERELNHLRRYRRVFNGVSTIGPLLGLLGTVFGLIRSFNDVAASGAMGRPDLLARGFGEALITTAMGLLVAIPAMVLHWTFTSRVDRLAMRLDETCQQVIDEISQEALAESRAAEAKRKAG
jgi:biopolymer transport protein ExbB